MLWFDVSRTSKENGKLLNFFVRIEFSLQNFNSTMTECFSFSIRYRQNAIDFSPSHNALFVNNIEEWKKKNPIGLGANGVKHMANGVAKLQWANFNEN